METLSRARLELNRQPKIVLSEELAERVNAFVGLLPDEYRLASLAGSWKSVCIPELREGIAPPPTGYEEFLELLNSQEHTQLCRLWYSARHVAGPTLGDVRQWAEKKIIPRGIGSRGKNFLLLASRKDTVLIF